MTNTSDIIIYKQSQNPFALVTCQSVVENYCQLQHTVVPFSATKPSFYIKKTVELKMELQK